MARYVNNKFFTRCGDKAAVTVDGGRVVIRTVRNTMGKQNMLKGKSTKVNMLRENMPKEDTQKANSGGMLAISNRGMELKDSSEGRANMEDRVNTGRASMEVKVNMAREVMGARVTDKGA